MTLPQESRGIPGGTRSLARTTEITRPNLVARTMTNVRRRRCIFQDITAESSVAGASCFVPFYSAARLREPRARRSSPPSPRKMRTDVRRGARGYYAIHARAVIKPRRARTFYFILVVALIFNSSLK